MDCVLVLSLVVSSHATRHAAGIPATHSLLGILPQLWVNQLFLWSENVGLNIYEKSYAFLSSGSFKLIVGNLWNFTTFVSSIGPHLQIELKLEGGQNFALQCFQSLSSLNHLIEIKISKPKLGRWTKLRFAMVPFTVFLEPFSECMLAGALASLSSYVLFRLEHL